MKCLPPLFFFGTEYENEILSSFCALHLSLMSFLRLVGVSQCGSVVFYTLYNMIDASTQALTRVCNKQHRYPDSCLNFQYDANFPIRGLYYDKKVGYLLKLDFFHSVQPAACFFGRRRVIIRFCDASY